MININGEIFSPENAKISVFDRGLLYGDSVFEVTLCYGEIPFLIEEHLDRLWHSAKGLYFTPTFSRDYIKEQILLTLRASRFEISYMRLILTRGAGELSLSPTDEMKNNLIIIVQEHKPLPAHYYTKGVSLAYAEAAREDHGTKDPSVKSGNYSSNYLAYMSAKKQGAYEPIILNREGFVAEGSTSNMWMIKDGIIKTPCLEVGILAGLTRAIVLQLAKKNNLPIEEGWIKKEEFEAADEIFITSSTRTILPVNTILPAGRKLLSVNDNSLTNKLLGIYRQFVKEYLREQEIKGWRQSW